LYISTFIYFKQYTIQKKEIEPDEDPFLNVKEIRGEEDPSDNNIEEYSDKGDCHTHSKVSLIERHA
jgi:hypothetical protein